MHRQNRNQIDNLEVETVGKIQNWRIYFILKFGKWIAWPPFNLALIFVKCVDNYMSSLISFLYGYCVFIASISQNHIIFLQPIFLLNRLITTFYGFITMFTVTQKNVNISFFFYFDNSLTWPKTADSKLLIWAIFVRFCCYHFRSYFKRVWH